MIEPLMDPVEQGRLLMKVNLILSLAGLLVENSIILMKLIYLLLFVVSVVPTFGQGSLLGGRYFFSDPPDYEPVKAFLTNREWTSKIGSTFTGVLKEIKQDTVIVERSGDKIAFEIKLDDLSESDTSYVEKINDDLIFDRLTYFNADWVDGAENDAAFFAYIFLKRIDQNKLAEALDMVGQTEGGNPLVTPTIIEQKRSRVEVEASKRIKVSSQVNHQQKSYSYVFTFNSLFGDQTISETVTLALQDKKFSVTNYR